MWSIERFGDGSLATSLAEIFSRTEELGTPSVSPLLLDTVSGWFDPRGTRRGRQIAAQIALAGALHASDMQTAIRTLAADIGRRDKLYRRWADDSVQWALLRLLDVSIQRAWPRKTLLPVSMLYHGAGPWQGENYHVWYLDSGEYLDAGLNLGGSDWVTHGASSSRIIGIPGNIRQNDVILRIKPVSTNMTSVTITCTVLGIDLTYGGTVTAGQILEIDSAGMTVTNNGVSDYDNLTINSGHSLDRFLAVEPGANTFTFLATGPTNIQTFFELYGAWA